MQDVELLSWGPSGHLRQWDIMLMSYASTGMINDHEAKTALRIASVNRYPIESDKDLSVTFLLASGGTFNSS